MIQKYILFIISAVLAFSACENEIPFKVESTPSKLILNALFEVERDTNYISLGLTGRDYATLVNEAAIHIYINNELKDVITEIDSINNYYALIFYKTALKFSPGDRIRIDAKTNDGKYHAWVEDIVPQPIEIEKVDTLRYFEKTSWSSSVDSHLRLKATFTDNLNEKNYYRLVVSYDMEYYGTSQTTGRDTNYVMSGYSPELIIREDIALNDGRPPMDDSGYPLPQIENRLNIFDDSRINGTYTLNVSYSSSIINSIWEIDLERVSEIAKVRLISLTKDQFYYFKALNSYLSDNYDDFLSQPISYPSNIQGGVGIFGISAGSEYTIQLADYIPTGEEQ